MPRVVEYVLFDMDGASVRICSRRFTHSNRTHDRFRENLHHCDQLVQKNHSAAHIGLQRRADQVLKKYGKEMSWDIKAGCMGKRTQSHVDPVDTAR